MCRHCDESEAYINAYPKAERLLPIYLDMPECRKLLGLAYNMEEQAHRGLLELLFTYGPAVFNDEGAYWHPRLTN